VRRILRYLIPAKMLLGELPSDRLLDTYHLQEYRDLKRALQAGDVGLLNKALQVRAAGLCAGSACQYVCNSVMQCTWDACCSSVGVA
jgi:hypothetical protein